MSIAYGSAGGSQAWECIGETALRGKHWQRQDCSNVGLACLGLGCHDGWCCGSWTDWVLSSPSTTGSGTAARVEHRTQRDEGTGHSRIFHQVASQTLLGTRAPLKFVRCNQEEKVEALKRSAEALENEKTQLKQGLLQEIQDSKLVRTRSGSDGPPFGRSRPSAVLGG